MKMQRTLGVLSATALSLGLGSAGLTIAGAAGDDQPSWAGSGGHALFVETGNVSANTVLSYSRAADGSISLAGSYLTGGQGGVAAGATADPLGSQGGLSLLRGGRLLAAVNAGSNTVSLFAVNGSSLALLQTVGSGGEFPVSISSSGDRVAVLNAGGAGSLAEFRLDGFRLVPLGAQTRSLGLANTNPPNFVHGAGQVGFSPDGRHLIVTTKASTSAYEVFNVAFDGSLSANAVVTQSATPVPFAFSFDAAGHLVGAEAATSTVSSYTINADGTLTSIGSVSDGAAALCWITGANGTFYGSNAGSATVSSFSLNAGGAPVLDAAAAASTEPGTTDSTLSADGRFLYVESGGSGALDAFRINLDGSLSHVETIWNLPVGSEGIAAS